MSGRKKTDYKRTSSSSVSLVRGGPARQAPIPKAPSPRTCSTSASPCWRRIPPGWVTSPSWRPQKAGQLSPLCLIFFRKAVGWATSKTNDTALPVAALGKNVEPGGGGAHEAASKGGQSAGPGSTSARREPGSRVGGLVNLRGAYSSRAALARAMGVSRAAAT